MTNAAALAALSLALGGAGCFASWGAVQLSGGARFLEEGAREVSVPEPGAREELAISLPLTVDPPTPATATASGPAAPPAPRPWALGCETTQRATDTVHRSAFRYGKKWKYVTATMFLAETAIAAAYYFGGSDRPQDRLAAGALALDAVGTAALFFAPRKEIYRAEPRSLTDRVRTDCPDGLVLDIGGERYPIDAAGRIGDLGLAALDAWMQSPGAPLRIEYAGHAAELAIGPAELCAWSRSHPAAPANPADPASPSSASPGGPGAQSPHCPTYGQLPPRQVSARIEVPLGTLTRLEAGAPP